MRAVVLVGGFGTRLRPLTLTTPKSLLPVGHLPMLERVLANLARGGVTEAVLSLGFRPDDFIAAYPDGTCAGVRLAYAVEPEPLDTAGAIRFAAGLGGIGETFIVVNGDVLTDLDVASLLALHRPRGAEATIHLTPVADPSAFGVVPTDEDGRVQAFIEKPPRDEAPTNLVNAGTYVLEASVLARIEPDLPASIERRTFPAMVEDGTLYAMATDDYWLDTGRPELYRQANLDILEGRRTHDRCDPVAAGARVDAAALVERAIVGTDACIEGGAVVSRSVVLPRVRVGRDARLVDSIVGTGAVIGAGAHLVEVVVGADVAVEEGARLSGTRVPEPV